MFALIVGSGASMSAKADMLLAPLGMAPATLVNRNGTRGSCRTDEFAVKTVEYRDLRNLPVWKAHHLAPNRQAPMPRGKPR
jgi:hypothetical protein